MGKILRKAQGVRVGVFIVCARLRPVKTNSRSEASQAKRQLCMQERTVMVIT